MVALDRVSGASLLYQIEQMADAGDFGHSESLDGEEADDDQDRESVEVVGQEAMAVSILFLTVAYWNSRRLDTADESVQDDSDRQKEGRCNDVDASPVKISTKPASCEGGSLQCGDCGGSTEQHVRHGNDVVDKTKAHVHDMSSRAYLISICSTFRITPKSPYLRRTISRSVCASGIFRLQEIPSKAKKTIIGLHPAANQKGPASP